MIIKCKMCGGDMELSADRSIGTCDSCGSTMTMPKVDDEQRAAAFNRGNHFRRIGEFDKAMAVYERIIREDENDAEAHWCCALCRFGIEYVEDPASYEWLPTCHRASFDSFLEDVDYLAALEHSDGIARRQYQKAAAKIAEVQRGILAASQNEEPFDVFICYKETGEDGQRTRDSLMAQDIYYQLTNEGYRVFFARLTLEDKAGTQYEPYIFAALNSAKVMVAVGTKPEHFNAVWVKNEWSRFLSLMKKDRSRLLLPCYRDMDPYDLPEQLAVLQSYDMGKIGFIQDLVRGIKKVLEAGKESTAPAVKETVVVQSEGGANVTALIKRGNMALEDGEWGKAKEFFDQVLNQNAECAEAYLGMLLAEEESRSLDALEAALKKRWTTLEGRKETIPLDAQEQVRAAVEQYAVRGYLSKEQIEQIYAHEPLSYTMLAREADAGLRRAKSFFEGNRRYVRACSFAGPELKGKLERMQAQVIAAVQSKLEESKKEDAEAVRSIKNAYSAHLKQAEETARERHQTAVKRAERDYKAGSKAQQEANSAVTYDAAARAFEKMKGYRDSAQRAEQCRKEAERIRAEEIARREAEIAAEAQRKKDRTVKLVKTIVAVIVAIAVAAAVFIFVIHPPMSYSAAEKLLEEGNTAGAAMAFGRLGTYMDAADRSKELWDQIGQLDTVSKGSDHTVTLKPDGTVEAIGDNSYGQCDVSGWTGIVSVSAGYWHTLGLKSDGTVVGTGSNTNGQCDVSGWTDIVAVSAGDYHTVGLKSNGTVVAIGWNWYGQCDVSGWTDIIAISTRSDCTAGLKSDGTVVVTGRDADKLDDISDWPEFAGLY